MTTHYIAVLNVTATDTTTETKDRYDKVIAVAGRTVTDAANIVVRANTMQSLQTKLIAHIALLNEE